MYQALSCLQHLFPSPLFPTENINLLKMSRKYVAIKKKKRGQYFSKTAELYRF